MYAEDILAILKDAKDVKDEDGDVRWRRIEIIITMTTGCAMVITLTTGTSGSLRSMSRSRTHLREKPFRLPYRRLDLAHARETLRVSLGE
jgi:hypothetical protein